MVWEQESRRNIRHYRRMFPTTSSRMSEAGSAQMALLISEDMELTLIGEQYQADVEGHRPEKEISTFTDYDADQRKYFRTQGAETHKASMQYVEQYLAALDAYYAEGSGKPNLYFGSQVAQPTSAPSRRRHGSSGGGGAAAAAVAEESKSAESGSLGSLANILNMGAKVLVGAEKRTKLDKHKKAVSDCAT
jgi:hypothetical protein